MAQKLFSKDGEYPQVVEKIRLPDGTTRTDSNTFTEEEISSAGYTGPYYEPEFDSQTQELSCDSEHWLIELDLGSGVQLRIAQPR